MDRGRPRGSLEEDLRHIEAKLRRLTLQVSEARQLEAHQRSQPKELSVGDRVRIRILGTGQVEGTIVAVTARGLRIQPDGSTKTVLRAPKNVVLIGQDDGTASATATGARP